MNEAYYNDLRPKLKTGDVVLMSGRGIESAAIKLATRSKWSHVGQLVVIPQWDLILLWESTTLSNIVDMVTGVAHRGVSLVALSERLRAYKGRTALRALSRPLTAEMDEGLQRFRHEVRELPYEDNSMELLKSAWDGGGGMNEADLSSLFCSELLAESWMRVGLLGTQQPANEYVPRDFSSGARKPLPLFQGYTLLPEVQLS